MSTTSAHGADTTVDVTDRTQEQMAADVEAFAGRLIEVLNGGALATLISIGHQVGLFDAMAGMPPATSQQIADAAALQERYVREWLGAMATGRIVHHDPDAGTYVLPEAHAACLTTAAGPDNMARVMQYLPLMGTVEQAVAAAFRDGGGVPYEAYGRFHQLMAEESGAVFDAALVDQILPLVPGLPDLLGSGIDVADVGCGRGHAVVVMAQAFPASRFTGLDLSADAIAVGRAEAAAHGLGNATFVAMDAATMQVEAAYDLITAFDCIHDQAHPAAVLANIRRALRPDGTFLMVDIKAQSRVEDNMDLPWAPFLYAVSTMHCMTVSLAQGGDGLGTVWGRQTAERMLAEAGFGQVSVAEVEADPFNDYYLARG